jgi:hypothetical protein
VTVRSRQLRVANTWLRAMSDNIRAHRSDRNQPGATMPDWGRLVPVPEGVTLRRGCIRPRRRVIRARLSTGRRAGSAMPSCANPSQVSRRYESDDPMKQLLASPSPARPWSVRDFTGQSLRPKLASLRPDLLAIQFARGSASTHPLMNT